MTQSLGKKYLMVMVIVFIFQRLWLSANSDFVTTLERMYAAHPPRLRKHEVILSVREAGGNILEPDNLREVR